MAAGLEIPIASRCRRHAAAANPAARMGFDLTHQGVTESIVFSERHRLAESGEDVKDALACQYRERCLGYSSIEASVGASSCQSV